MTRSNDGGAELVALTARQAVAALARGDVTPRELIEAAMARIDEVDGRVNALPTRCPERALERAAHVRVEDGGPGLLHGLPIAVKDLTDVAGVRTTYGSRLFADHVPDTSDPLVERLESRGAIVLCKSNTPEFGAGSHTFNDVFGVTRNPWDLSRSAGGSSGGSAAALATGQILLATGTDLGGSLRNPASFCGVVGLRPGLGTVPRAHRDLGFPDLSVDGPMGRTVGDVALLLDAMGARPERRADGPSSRSDRDAAFVTAADRPVLPRRVAFSPDLGITPIDPGVVEVCERAAAWFAANGCVVEVAHPDLHDARETFHVLRARAYAAQHRALLAHRDVVKEEVIWNIEVGLRLQPSDIERAERAHARMQAATATFFEGYDLLLCPAAVVTPFPAEWRWPHEVAGQAMQTYLDWLLICSAVTLMGCPALSVPAGLSAEGLPIGVQVVAPPGGEYQLLSAAATFESDHDLAGRLPRSPLEA